MLFGETAFLSSVSRPEQHSAAVVGLGLFYRTNEEELNRSRERAQGAYNNPASSDQVNIQCCQIFSAAKSSVLLVETLNARRVLLPL